MRGYKKFDYSKITPELKQLLVNAANPNRAISEPAMIQLCAAIIGPALRAGIVSGDIVTDIYDRIVLEPGVETKYPLDFLAPGTENDHVAYTVPNQGRVPNLVVEGDDVMIPTFPVANSIDINRRYLENSRWDVMSRLMEVLEAGHVKKRNDDGWHLILAAGLDRNIVVYDSAASAGQFTKRLVSLMKIIMRRNGGGNSTSLNRFQLTDLYISPESHEDIRNWNIDQVDELTRRELYLAADEDVSKIFNVFLHSLDELGEDQEYQLFFLNDLGGALASSDTELVVGLDLVTAPVFKMPVIQDMQVFPDDSQRRSRKMGWWSEEERGFGILDNRPVLLGSL